MEQQAEILYQTNRQKQTAVLRAVWLLVFLVVIFGSFLAIPARYQMMVADVYELGAELAELGVSLHFFAIYFIFWELVLVAGSLLVAGIIGWRKGDDPFALLTAMLLTLLGYCLTLCLMVSRGKIPYGYGRFWLCALWTMVCCNGSALPVPQWPFSTQMDALGLDRLGSDFEYRPSHQARCAEQYGRFAQHPNLC